MLSPGRMNRGCGWGSMRADLGRHRLDVDELVDGWKLGDEVRGQVGDKRGAARLVFALLLKFYARAGRFPRGRARRRRCPGQW